MTEKLPQHIAIVMDGNGRWAQNRGLPRADGHHAGIESVKSVVQCCLEKKVSILSLFAFSSENWLRPAQEVDCLMQLFVHALAHEIQSLHEHGVSLRFTGERTQLSPELQERMTAAENLTCDNKALILNIAVNYSGKWDLVQATKIIASEVAQGRLRSEDINDAVFNSFLSTSALPDPDLFIRTSGELRISNFFLWQLAYTELYFTDIHWPDFTAKELEKALSNYAGRERRYGQLPTEMNENCYV